MTAFRLVVTEGLLEVPVVQKLLASLGISDQSTVYVRPRGSFWDQVPRYNDAARHNLVLGLADLESSPCPSGLIAEHLPRGVQPQFVLRIAERMLESWLLADRESLADFLRVSPHTFPRDPEGEEHPKRTLVNLARNSPDRAVLSDMVPEAGSRGIAGRAYRLRMTEYVSAHWRPSRVARRSPSLRRAIVAIKVATQT
jgi:hypothetical protein